MACSATAGIRSYRRTSMTLRRGLSRRDLFLKVGIIFNGLVGAVLAIPIVRYILSPITRGRKPGYETWLPLGSIDQFPAGQTRLASYRTRWRIPGMEKRRTSLAGCVIPMA